MISAEAKIIIKMITLLISAVTLGYIMGQISEARKHAGEARVSVEYLVWRDDMKRIIEAMRLNPMKTEQVVEIIELSGELYGNGIDVLDGLKRRYLGLGGIEWEILKDMERKRDDEDI